MFYLLNLDESPDDTPLVLPVNWAYNILDEFVYDFQSFAELRANLESKTDDEIELLTINSEVIQNCDISIYKFISVFFSPLSLYSNPILMQLFRPGQFNGY